MESSNKFVNKNQIKSEFLRYLSFWPIFLISVIIFITSAYIYLRYAQYNYKSSSKIQILDKSQDSEMALPTSLTIFNRSMINLENEKGVLRSYRLVEKVVNSLDLNVRYFSVGTIKTSEDHKDQWFKDYELDFKIDTDSIENNYRFEILTKTKGNFDVSMFLDDKSVGTFSFEQSSTRNSSHDLPFELDFNFFQQDLEKTLIIYPHTETVKKFQDGTNVVSDISNSSDQLIVSLNHSNKKISEDFVNKLIYEFDKDGIEDRQLEYKRTMDFVDSRSDFLESELEKIENRKLKFKQNNNLTNLEADASNMISEKLSYNSDLFSAESQRDLALLLKESLTENNFEYLPVNIGVENQNINIAISEYNSLIKERETFLITAGKNNSIVKNVEKQILKYLSTITNSIDNYIDNLETVIDNISKKESEFTSLYIKVPENEKILRSIERELNIKEALFLLLLQKREEAAINFAVIKPSIKVIDSAISSDRPISPDITYIYSSFLFIGFLLPFIFLYLWFYLDNKIHTKSQLEDIINKDIPIISEIPHIRNKSELFRLASPSSRNIISESIRMLIANLRFVFKFSDESDFGSVVLVTSSVKGEGKTLISSNISALLSSSVKKVLLIGADLRNPQIHKIISKDKSVQGLSDMIYKNDTKNYKKYLLREDNLDILLSGTIPPNPSEMLSSERFRDLIDSLKNEYDYIVIDSAPCLLVSDTFEISKLADLTLYVVRASYSSKELADFINENKRLNKLKNVNLILNSVGNSSAYGYKYGYQYGYRYGYKYGYNYGYGYGYSEDKD